MRARTVIAQLAASALLVVACHASVDATSAPLPTRPPVPGEWSIVAGGAGDVRVALPPWLDAFDTARAVFANERPQAVGGPFVELLAEGPLTAELQPRSQGEIAGWFAERLGLDERERGNIQPQALPAGDALTYEVTQGAGTRSASRIAAYAVVTSSGVGYLLIDGPPDLWQAHEADIALIPYLIEFGPAARAP